MYSATFFCVITFKNAAEPAYFSNLTIFSISKSSIKFKEIFKFLKSEKFFAINKLVLKITIPDRPSFLNKTSPLSEKTSTFLSTIPLIYIKNYKCKPKCIHSCLHQNAYFV